jgi:hypothetical protein
LIRAKGAEYDEAYAGLVKDLLAAAALLASDDEVRDRA